MKRLNLAAGLLLFLLTLVSGEAQNRAPAANDPLPDIRLSLPSSAQHREYLGLSTTAPNCDIGQIQGELLIIEIFSMYCPHCQAEAPKVNQLFTLLAETPDLRKRIKMIGIGVGNSAYEVDFFSKSYKIEFPLFSDEDFTIHKQIGEVRTPFFIVVRQDRTTGPRVIYTHTGKFDSAQQFLQHITQIGGK